MLIVLIIILIIVWLTGLNWLNDLLLESILALTLTEQFPLINGIKWLIVSEWMLFYACFWSLIHFRLISPGFSLLFPYPLLSSCSFAIPVSNLFTPLFSSVPIQAAQIFVKIGFLILTIEGLGQSVCCGFLFFDPLRGGDLLPFQHLFRFLGHPEVYIPTIPAFGLISEILSKYIQCFIFGRDSMLIALLIIGIIGRIVWGHHMFIVGFDINTRSYPTSATPIIAIPTGIKILNRFATLWSGCFFLISSLFFIIGFLLSSSFGGFTGLIPANRMIDTILHDSYFVVGHSHYVPSLGAVYTFFSAFYNYSLFFSSYYPFNEFLGRIHSPFFSISSNVISFSMHSPGILGSPRRIFDYPVIFFRYHRMNSFGTIGVLLSILRFIPPIAVLLILESFDVFWWNYCSTTFWYFPFILLFIFL